MSTKRLAKRRFHQAIVYTALAAATLLMAMPFYWMFITALKPPAEAAQFPPTWWPRVFTLENFPAAWQSAPFGRFYLNSILTGLATTFLQIGFAIPMAYAFAHIPAPRKGLLFIAIIATMLIPDEMKLIPNFLLLDRLGWIDTYWALIIPPAAHAFPVLVLHQQFLAIPRELLDAARADGASHLRVLCSVCVPLSMPIIAALAFIAFLGRWNDLLWPLIVTNTPAMRTLPVGLLYLEGGQDGGLQWSLLMAASLFVIMPILIIFVIAQRKVTPEVLAGALKR